MISEWFDSATVLNTFEPSGVSNVVQATDDCDILFIRARSDEQLNKLLDLNLPSSFKGLIVSPFTPKNSSLNFAVLSIDEIERKEIELIKLFYPVPSSPSKMIGVTGTNGKTSTCWLSMEIGQVLGRSVLYMGTIGVFLNGRKLKEKILTTTPSFLDLRKMMHRYQGKYDTVALEVSSHALEQNRLKHVKFDCVAWTNFSQDHLDFHGTMESYFQAKLRIVNYSSSAQVVASRSEEHAELRERISKSAKVLEALNLAERTKEIPNKFKNGFMRENLEVALTCMQETQDQSIYLNDLSQVNGPPGRLQVIEVNGVKFVIDYAHTPDALDKLLGELGRQAPDAYIITVFGCGGDRDKIKRPLMRDISVNKSDLVIVTSDNPRTENPEFIIDEIIGSVSGLERCSDRRAAIEKAYTVALGRIASSEAIVVVAGKGDEDYQEISGVRHHFSDAEVVRGLK